MRVLAVLLLLSILPLPARAQHFDSPVRLVRHIDSVTSVEFSRDGTMLVSTSVDGSAVVWDATWRVVLHHLRHGRDQLNDAAFARGDRWLAVTSPQRMIVWDLRTQTVVDTIMPWFYRNRTFTSVRYMLNDYVVTAGGGAATMIDLTRRETPEEANTEDQTITNVVEAAPLPGGGLVFAGTHTGRAGRPDCFSVTRFAMFDQFGPEATLRRIDDFEGPHSSRSSIDAHPSEPVVAVTGWGPGVLGYNWTSGVSDSFRLAHDGATRVRFSGDGRFIASLSRTLVRVWDHATKTLLAERSSQGEIFFDVAFSPDGRNLAVAASDGVWLFGPPIEKTRVLVTPGPLTLPRTFSGAATDASVTVIRTSDSAPVVGARLRLRKGSEGFAIVGPDTLTVAPGAESGVVVRFAPQRHGLMRDTLELAFGAGLTGTRMIALVGDAMRYRLVAHDDTVIRVDGAALRFTPDGRHFVAIGTGIDSVSATKVFETVTGSQILEIPRESVYALDSTAMLMSTRKGDSLLVRSLPEGSITRTILLGGPHPTAVHETVVESLTGRLARRFEDSIYVWDLATGALVSRFRPHSRPINTVVFDPTGARLLTCAIDYSVAISDIATGTVLHRIALDSGWAQFGAFSPDWEEVIVPGITDAKVYRTFDASLVRVLGGHRDQVVKGAFSRSGGLVLTESMDSTIRIHRRGSWELVSVIELGEKHSQWQLSPDETRLFVGHSFGVSASVYDVATGRLLRRWAPGKPRVTLATYRPDGAWLAAGVGSESAIWGPSYALPYVRPSDSAIDLRTSGTTTDTTISVTLENTGPMTLDLTATIEPTGSAFTVEGDPSIRLLPFGSAPVRLRFDASRAYRDRNDLHGAAAEVRALLSLEYGSAGSVADVWLKGEGSGPSLSAAHRESRSNASVRVRPNPARDLVAIDLDQQVAGRTIVRLVDALGATVRTLDERFREAGAATLDATLDGVPAGVYSVIVDSGSRIDVARLVVR